MQGMLVNEELFPLNSEKREKKDMRVVLLSYLKYWYLFLAGAIISLGCAFMYLRYHTKTYYQVESKILIKDDINAGGGYATGNALSELEMFNSGRLVDNEILILNSKTLMERVVNELALSTNYHIEGQFQDTELYGQEVPIKLITTQINPSAFNKEIFIKIKNNNTLELATEPNAKAAVYNFGQRIVTPYATFTAVLAYKTTQVIPTPTFIKVRFLDRNQVVNNLHKSLKVTQAGKITSVLSISLTDPKPERAKDIINKLIELYNKEEIEDQNAIASNTLAFLDERLNFLTSEISEVERNVEQYKSKNEVTDVNSQASGYLEQANDYNKQLSDWAIQIEVLASIENYLKQNKGQYKIVPSTLGIEDQTLMGLIGKFNELQLERERMLRTTNQDSPLIQNINEQLANLRLNILENLTNIKRSLIITRNKLQASSNQFKTKIRKVPSMERQLLVINRQQSIKQNLYLYLLQKREETAISLAASVSHSRIIDPAIVESSSVLPNKSIIYLLSLLLGLGLPFAGIFLSKWLNDKVQTRQEIENLTKTPILGELCRNTIPEPIVVTKGSRNPIAEMFRMIRTNLSFASAGQENRVILVTSSISGEGKTFFTMNLGASLSLTGKKVVLLSLDLRRPQLTRELATSNNIGITNYLTSDKYTIEELITPVETSPDLYVIGSGPIPPNPAEIMMSAKLAYLIEELKDMFDFIIIDSAPVGMVADAFTLSSLVDSTLYVVRYNYTLRSQLEIVDNIFKNKILPRPLLVLNDSKKKGQYGYGYGTYGEDQKKRKEIYDTI